MWQFLKAHHFFLGKYNLYRKRQKFLTRNKQREWKWIAILQENVQMPCTK